MSQLRNHSVLFGLSITFLLFGCHKDDDVTGLHTILTLQVDAAYPVSADNWIFATNDGGEVLDVKSYTAGETVTLVSDKAGDKISVTFFGHHEAPTMSSFSTYTSIPSGTVLHFAELTSPAQGLQPGKAKFMISNYGYGDGAATLAFSNGSSYSTHSEIFYSETDTDVSFYGVPSDFILTGYSKGVPMYNWARGVKDGDVIKRDFDVDFVPFPHQRKLDFEGETDGFIYGWDANSNLIPVLGTDQLTGTAYSNQPVIGYLDDFVSYDMVIINTKKNGSVTYQTSGAPDLSFTIPTFTFSLNSNGMQDLSFSFSETYTYYLSAWTYMQDTEYISWYFKAPAGEPVKGLTLPGEIMAKYPQIDMSKFKHSNISFTKIVEGNSYLESFPGVTATSTHKNQKLYSFSPKL